MKQMASNDEINLVILIAMWGLVLIVVMWGFMLIRLDEIIGLLEAGIPTG